MSLLLGLAACAPSTERSAPVNADRDSGDVDAVPIFVDRAAELGLEHWHFNGMVGRKDFHEVVGPGVALFDFDGDGDLDVYLVQGNPLLPDDRPEDAVFPPSTPPPLSDRLFRNDLRRVPDGRLRPRFVDVTERAGLRAMGYGMGVAVGDYDRDGHLDLYVTNYGPNELWRNRGDGSFEDVTVIAGVEDDRWSTSAAWVDLDRDGFLDLYSTNYVDYDVATDSGCRNGSGVVEYCGPRAFPPVPDRLWRNRGDGTFEDVSLAVHGADTAGSGLGVVAADLDDDGWTDLYVANDQRANFLWRHPGPLRPGDWRLEEAGLSSGTALDRDGRAQASMGVDAGDVDGDGDLDLFMTHLKRETNTLYLNDGTGFFTDRSSASGLAGPSLPLTGFGTALVDWDLDGSLDVVVANGEVHVIHELARAGDPFPLGQKNLLLRNRGDGTFDEVPSDRAGESFGRFRVGRGLAVGDIDEDGDPDVLLANNAGPVELLVNTTGDGATWIGVDVRNADGAPALGASLRAEGPDGGVLLRRVRSDSSYCSANDPRVPLPSGIGTVEIRRRGEIRRWAGLPEGRYAVVGLRSREDS